MNCPKCNSGTVEVVSSLVECIRQYDKQYEVPKVVEKYEEKTLWARCCGCGFKLFGNVATKAFGVRNSDRKFDDVITDDELQMHLKWIYSRKRSQETATVREALRNGWQSSLKELWETYQHIVSQQDLDGSEIADLYEKQYRYNSERIKALDDWFAILDHSAELFLEEEDSNE